MSSFTEHIASGSCDTISSTGSESTASRERGRIGETEKQWVHAIISDDRQRVKVWELLKIICASVCGYLRNPPT